MHYLCLILLLLTACSSPAKLRDKYLSMYHSGQIPAAIGALQEEAFSPANSVWYLLNLATMQFAAGKLDQAIVSYNQALDALDYYAQPSSDDLTAQIVLEDACSGFAGAPFEQKLARVYFALALLQKGDLCNAEAVVQKADNALGRQLFALLLAKRGDESNAKIVDKGVVCNPHDSTLLVVCHNGNAPSKCSVVAPASQASTVALELFLRQPVALSSLPGIAIPAYFNWPGSQPMATFAQLNGRTKPLMVKCNIEREAYATQEQERPVVIARGVARYLLRRGCVYVANEQNETLGALIDLGCLIANCATEADTRAWDTLPASIDVAQFDVPPGQYPLQIQVGNRFYTKMLTLKPGELRVINIFNIHPGITLL